MNRYFTLLIIFLSFGSQAMQYNTLIFNEQGNEVIHALVDRAKQLTLSDVEGAQNSILFIDTSSDTSTLNASSLIGIETIVLSGDNNASVMMDLLGYSVDSSLIVIHHASDKDKREISKFSFSTKKNNVSDIAMRVFKQIDKVSHRW